MAGPWVKASVLYPAIAAALHQQPSETLSEEWKAIATHAVDDAYHDIRGLLSAKGYSSAQIDSADERVSWNRRQASYLIGNRGKGYADFDVSGFEVDNLLDRLREDPRPVHIGGEAVVPEGPVGGISHGLSTAADDLIEEQRLGAFRDPFENLRRGY